MSSSSARRLSDCLKTDQRPDVSAMRIFRCFLDIASFSYHFPQCFRFYVLLIGLNLVRTDITVDKTLCQLTIEPAYIYYVCNIINCLLHGVQIRGKTT